MIVLLLATASSLSVTRRGLARVIGGGVSFTGAALARAEPYDLSKMDSVGVGAERNNLDFAPGSQPQQMASPGKLDVNAASVTEYKQFRGLYPSVAGKVASHGPSGAV